MEHFAKISTQLNIPRQIYILIICSFRKMLNTLIVSGRVLDEECRQGIHAMLDVWQGTKSEILKVVVTFISI